MSSDQFDIVFIIGTGRCGSSLVHELVARNRQVGFISNVDDNLPGFDLHGRFNNRIFRSQLGRFTEKGRLRFAPSEAYNLITRLVSPVYAKSCRNLTANDVTPALRSAFRTFFTERYKVQGKPVFLHKYTGWSRALFFKEIFPEARFVHVVRDGRSVASSFLRMNWWTGYEAPEKWYLGPLSPEDTAIWENSGKSFVTLAGLAWKILIQSIVADSKKLPEGSLLTVRYEDFVMNPEEWLASICNFSKIEFDADHQRESGKSRIRSQSSPAHVKDLTSDQLEELTRVIGPWLTQFEYKD